MPTKETTKETIKPKKEEVVKLRGKYIEAVGRRKTSIARVRLYKKGTGVIIVNNDKINNIFSVDKVAIIKSPLKLTGLLKELNFSISTTGGGIKGQAEAIRHGIVQALIRDNEELKPVLKAKGWVTRDARIKERKKPGLKKARKAPQWSKR